MSTEPKRQYKIRGMDERSISWICGPLGSYTTQLVMLRTFMFLFILIGVIVDAATYHLAFKSVTEIDKKVDWALWCFKPTNWTGVATLFYLLLMITLHGAYNKERRFSSLITPLVTYYLFNINGVFTWVNMVFYFSRIRLSQAYEPALEYTLISSCIVMTIEWLFVNHYVTYDVIFYVYLTFACVMFYISSASLWYNVNLFSQFNWVENYTEARLNTGYLLVVTTVVTLIWFIVLRAKTKCRESQDVLIEVAPIDKPIVESAPSYTQINQNITNPV